MNKKWRYYDTFTSTLFFVFIMLPFIIIAIFQHYLYKVFGKESWLDDIDNEEKYLS